MFFDGALGLEPAMFVYTWLLRSTAHTREASCERLLLLTVYLERRSAPRTCATCYEVVLQV